RYPIAPSYFFLSFYCAPRDLPSFPTRRSSDLHLYPRLGMEGMLRQMRGEFAFALYDRDEDALYLVRDRFGIKPLYWTNTGDAFVDRKSTRLNSSHVKISYAVFCLKKKKRHTDT